MKRLVILFLSLFAGYLYADCDENAEKLIRAYPQQLAACRDNYIIWHNGERQLYDDGKEKSFEQLLNSPDLEDMFTFPYPVGANSYHPPGFNVDPGRIRNDAFFKRLYGKSRAEVAGRLVTIDWMPQSTRKTVRITQVEQIDQQLERISAELDALPAHLKQYVLNTSGTFNWRVISGTNRLSAHSFAIAIDIDAQKANYWKWAGKNYRYQNNIPIEIVEIFEKHGFIWGGKWYHYDTMHFEYRPELL